MRIDYALYVAGRYMPNERKSPDLIGKSGLVEAAVSRQPGRGAFTPGLFRHDGGGLPGQVSYLVPGALRNALCLILLPGLDVGGKERLTNLRLVLAGCLAQAAGAFQRIDSLAEQPFSVAR